MTQIQVWGWPKPPPVNFQLRVFARFDYMRFKTLTKR